MSDLPPLTAETKLRELRDALLRMQFSVGESADRVISLIDELILLRLGSLAERLGAVERKTWPLVDPLRQRCDGCDGHDCDDGCAYPGAGRQG